MMRFTAAAASVLALARARPLSEVEGMFKKFLEEDEKVYEELEHKVRFKAFTENLEFIERENAKGHTYKLGLTVYADMTNDEFAMSYMGYRPSTKQWGDLPYLGSHQVGSDPVPDSMDWREKSAVTAVKNQGQCGSCWAFSTTGSLEGAWAIASGSLVSFSEQQLVDCSRKFGEMGCGGGSMDGGFQYAQQTSMCTEDSYPYHAKNSICKQAGCSVGLPKGGVVGFKDVKVDDPTALMSAVAQQPVSVAIEADKMAFQLYKSGVLSKACGDKLDHGVLAVGYGNEDGTDYWLVKNSWGPQWGMDGYVKIERVVTKEGECGINMDPSYPVVKIAPVPGPSPGPAPSPVPASGEYEKPPCGGDEVEAQVQGADGVLCAPPCDGMSCPDAPSGTKAEPQCVLSDSASGKKFCALTCHRSSSCPEGATCASLGFTGICVYPSDATMAPKAMSIDSSEATIAV